MREQLLGYVLGALDSSEQAELEARLAADPQLRRDLEEVRASLAPLDEDDTDPTPPSGLAERTCRFVCSYAGWRPWSAGTEALHSGGAWRVQDVLVAAGIFAAASMLIFPAISTSVSGSRRLQCQNNLRAIGMALGQYSDHHNGLFPFVPPNGKLSAAGIYAPMLFWGGYLQRPCQVLCPDSCTNEQRNRPVATRDEIVRADPATLRIIHAHMGGSFAYQPGYTDEDGEYHGTRNRGRTFFAIVADTPGWQPGGGSPNHGFRGQNVLFESGRVVFLIECRLVESGDDIYTNRDGYRGAGRGEHDASLSPSSTPPLVYPVVLDRR